MTVGKSLAWVGAAAFAVALFLLVNRTPAESPTAPAAEQDLFPFLKYGVATTAPATPAEIPSATKPQAKAPATHLAVEQAAQRMRAGGASDDDIYRMRASATTPEDAARLAQMEAEERAWHARVDAYLAERSRLEVGGGNISPALVEQLRNSRFTADEQARLAAYASSGVPQLILPEQ